MNIKAYTPSRTAEVVDSKYWTAIVNDTFGDWMLQISHASGILGVEFEGKPIYRSGRDFQPGDGHPSFVNELYSVARTIPTTWLED